MNYNYSLIIPHYNIPKLLRRLLSTVPRRDDMQVIVVDDCSTKELDELENVRKDYYWVEWYTTGTNGGGGKARNIGLDHAKGKYLIFADADDYFNENLNIVLNRYRNSTSDLIYFNISSVDSNLISHRIQEYNSIIDLYQTSPDRAMDILRFVYYCPWAKFINKSLIEKHHIKYEEVPIHNDVLFSGLIGIYAKNIEVSNIKIYILTERDGSASRILNTYHRISRLRTFAILNSTFKNNGYDYINPIMLEPVLYFLKKLDLSNLFMCVKILRHHGFSPVRLIYNHIFRR